MEWTSSGGQLFNFSKRSFSCALRSESMFLPFVFFPTRSSFVAKGGTAYDGKNLVVIEMMRKLRVDLSCESGLWNVVGGSIARPFHIPAAQPSLNIDWDLSRHYC